MTDFIEQQRTLVDMLADRTKDKKLEWKIDPSDSEPFCKMDGYYVKITEGRNSSGSSYYRIIIEDNDEKEIISFTDEDIDIFEGSEKLKFYKIMKDLISTARFEAKGVDKAISAIIKGLSNLS